MEAEIWPSLYLMGMQPGRQQQLSVKAKKMHMRPKTMGTTMPSTI